MSWFEGLPFEAVDFYEELELNNSREWWAVHRQLYDTVVRAPMEGLAAALEDEFGPAKLFRPSRDVRFSQDKSPYKTHQGIVVATASGMGWYVQISSAGLMTAAGWYAGTAGQVARYRGAVDDEDSGEELQRIVDGLREDGYVIDGDRLKTRPRGVAEDHPLVEMLRHRTLTAERQHGAPGWLPTPEMLDRVAVDWRAYRPLMAWLGEHVGEG
ncbi:DUF2461 domain-containing protein [Tessaracoccus sp. MC1627]|uniref:DUF2461 domain-containing protein n=1 Tax=Tessaracoccus sp. MC1627 TaxID=2760312 RepID=UPI001602DDB9|nr:DUF2461 domain-containing protein [Tessaracoccus sp. MC1627]MBB1514035.1 DUF2461 domain-containing protein [Tessaracoccus sp. MC1627]